MNRFLPYLFLAALFLSVAASDVVDLTSDNFQSTIEKNSYVLVSYTAPWCGHCKNLKPEFAKAATELKEKKIVLGNIDCTVEKDLCAQYQVQGYPTIKWFSKGQAQDYEAGRSKEDIVDFAVKFSGPAVTTLVDIDSVVEFSKEGNLVTVAFVAEDDSSSMALVQELGEEMRSTMRFGVFHGVMEGVESTPSLSLYRSFEEEPVAYTGEFTKTAIEEFFQLESFSLIDEISPQNYRQYLSRQLPLVWIFTPSGAVDEIVNVFKQAAVSVKGKLSLVHLDGENYKRHAENFGLDTSKFPAVAVDDFVNSKKYLYPQDEEVTVDAVSKFLTDVLEGSVSPHVKSEPLPEKNDEPVFVIVALSYNEIVMDTSKDVLVEYYAPWCGHCQQLEPKYNELGEMFKDHDTVVIAKVDATANDVPADIQGFPTIKFFPANAKETPITFEDARTTSDLAKFVLTHSSTLTFEQKAALEPEDTEGDEDDEKDEL
jgi:protein disulfide-isomerase A1